MSQLVTQDELIGFLNRSRVTIERDKKFRFTYVFQTDNDQFVARGLGWFMPVLEVNLPEFEKLILNAGYCLEVIENWSEVNT